MVWHVMIKVVALLLTCSLAACSTTKLYSDTILGKELSRTVLEKRESGSNYTLKEIDPYTLNIVKNTCTFNYIRTENSELIRTTYKNEECVIGGIKYTFAYLGGTAISWGLLPVIDLFTGFQGVRKMYSDSCKSDITYKTEETGNKVTKEFLDETTKVCSNGPVTSGFVEVATGDQTFTLTPTADGLVSLPLRQIGYLENLDKKTTIVWKYENNYLRTASNVTPEQKQATVKKYLNKLTDEKLFTMALNDKSGFYKSDNKLNEAIRNQLPKYYRLERVANPSPEQVRQSKTANRLAKNENQVAKVVSDAEPTYRLVPTQERMYFKAGDYSGNLELPVIDFNEQPKPVELKTNIVARKANNLLPEYQNEDRNMKLVFKEANLRVTNKSDKEMKLNKLSLYYNGKFIDNILEQPMTLAPSATSNEIPLAGVIEREVGLLAKYGNLNEKQARRMKINFGLGAAYQDPESNAPAMMNKVNTYSVYDVVKNMAETARLDDHMVSLIDDKAIPPSELREMFSSVMKTSDTYDPTELQFDLKVEFDTGKATIRKEYLSNLNKVGLALKKYPKMRGIIEGHSDNMGSEEVNQKLSERRADAIKQYLTKKYGVEPDRIQAEGFGMARPIADNDTSTGRAQNRRIEGRFMQFEG